MHLATCKKSCATRNPRKKKNPFHGGRNSYFDDDIPDKDLRLFLKGIKQIVRNVIKCDPDSIKIEAYYEPGDSVDITFWISFPLSKAQFLKWGLLKTEITSQVHSYYLDKNLGIDFDLPTPNSARKANFKVGLMNGDSDSGEPRGGIEGIVHVDHIPKMNPRNAMRRKNPIDEKDVTECVKALLWLIYLPERPEAIPPKIRVALVKEKFWSLDLGVMPLGRDFLREYKKSVGNV